MMHEKAGAVAEKAAGGAAVATLVSGMTVNDICSIIGLFATLALVAYSAYCKRQHLKIARSLAEQKNATCLTCERLTDGD